MKSNEADLAGRMQFCALEGFEGRFAWVRDDDSLPSDHLIEILSHAERAKVAAYTVPEEQRHFVFRRAYQRLFVARATGWQGAAKSLALVHGVDQRPRCDDAPGFRLSFSSSVKTYLFGGCDRGCLGVDIEQERIIADATAMAHRFFTAAEARAVADLSDPERSRLFLTFWSAKEAGLKAMGRGVESGLNTFAFARDQNQWVILHVDKPPPASAWSMHLPGWCLGHIVAVLHRPDPK